MNQPLSDEIWITGFTDYTTMSVREQILNASDQMYPEEPIVLYINSHGGDIKGLVMLLDTLEEISNPVITYATGEAASCGAFLLAAGDYRFATRDTRIMIHEVRYNSVGEGATTLLEARNLHADLDGCQRMALGKFADNCGKTYDEVLDKIHKEGPDVWFSAEEALKYGIIDNIGTPEVYALGFDVSIAAEKGSQ